MVGERQDPFGLIPEPPLWLPFEMMGQEERTCTCELHAPLTSRRKENDTVSEVNLDSTLTANGALRVLQQLHRNGEQQGLQCKHKDRTYDGPRDDTA
jgi:hypothetical protein